MQLLDPPFNSIDRINSITLKHYKFLSDHLNKNQYSFSFINAVAEPYFNISVILNETYGGNCWNDNIYRSEYKFKKSKIIKSLIIFISTLVIRTNGKELKKMADIIFKKLESKEFYAPEYYNNSTSGLYFKIKLCDVIDMIKEHSVNL
jgi:hypothetical protein